VLKRLKATNGHPTRNVLKRCQSLIDGAFIPIPKTPCCSWSELITPTSYTNPSLDSTPSRSDGEKSIIKLEMLQSQSKSMAKVVSCFSTTSQIQDAFLVSKVEINNEKLNKMKICNMKAI